MLKSIYRPLISLSGRASRATYFWWTLAVLATFLVLFVFLETLVARGATWALYPFCFWALIALAVKRLHDRGQSAWWLLIVIIPVLGPLWLGITLLFRKGSPGENQYGGDPREQGADYLAVDIHQTGGAK